MPWRTPAWSGLGYLVAIVMAGVVLPVRLALNRVSDDASMFLPFVVAVLVAAWCGGLKPGLLATILSTLAASFIMLTSEAVPLRDSTALWVPVIMFLLVGTLISWLCDALHLARLRAETRHKELEAAQQDLRLADRRKDEFLAILSHELRTPLAPLRNALQVVRLAGDDHAMKEQALAMMDRQMQQLVRLIDDLLDVSRISQNRLELRKETCELSRALDLALEASGPVIAAAGHELKMELSGESILLEADAQRLAQVFANLLTNAAKYTERHGQIHLAAERQGSDAVVTVRDNGIGIAPEVLPYIFELFKQDRPALERSQGGLGIGLTLVRRLVELHAGSIEAHSDGAGKGSAFTVRLPVVIAPAPQVPHPAVREVPAAAPVARKVLVVDDNEDAAESLGMMLQIMGHEVHTAYDGLRALEVAETTKPEVVLLDIGMPKLNGYETARRLRERSWAKDVILVALTGWGQENDRRRSRDAGFHHHLVKPVPPEVLTAVLSGQEVPLRDPM